MPPKVTIPFVFLTQDDPTHNLLVQAQGAIRAIPGNMNQDGVEVVKANSLQGRDPTKKYYVVKTPNQTDAELKRHIQGMPNYQQAGYGDYGWRWTWSHQAVGYMLEAMEVERIALVAPEEGATLEGEPLWKLLSIDPSRVHEDYKTTKQGADGAPDKVTINAIQGAPFNVGFQLANLVVKMKDEDKFGRLNVIILPAKKQEAQEALTNEIKSKAGFFLISSAEHKTCIRILTPDDIPKSIQVPKAYELLSEGIDDDDEFDEIFGKMPTEVCGYGAKETAVAGAPATGPAGAEEDRKQKGEDNFKSNTGDVADAVSRALKDERPSSTFKSDKNAVALKVGTFDPASGKVTFCLSADVLEGLTGECDTRKKSEVLAALGVTEADHAQIKDVLDAMSQDQKDKVIKRIRDYRLESGSGLENSKALFEDLEPGKPSVFSTKKAQGRLMWKMANKALVFVQSVAHALCDDDEAALEVWLQVNKKNLKPHAIGKTWAEAKADTERSKQAADAKKANNSGPKSSPSADQTDALLRRLEKQDAKIAALLEAQANGFRKRKTALQRQDYENPNHTEVGEPLKGRNGGYMSAAQQAWTKTRKCAKCKETHPNGPFDCPKLKNASIDDRRDNEKKSYSEAVGRGEKPDN